MYPNKDPKNKIRKPDTQKTRSWYGKNNDVETPYKTLNFYITDLEEKKKSITYLKRKNSRKHKGMYIT